MKELDTTQVEQLKNIGATLRAERENQRVPLEEVAVKTYIPLRLLQALEIGQIDRLPEPVFIQGFIRRYADAIGLDGPAISKKFVFEPSPNPSQPVSTLEPAVATVPQESDEQPIIERSLAWVRSLQPAVIAGGLAVLGLGLIIAVGLNSSKHSPKKPTGTQPSSDINAQPQPSSSVPSATASPQATTQPTAVTPTTNTGNSTAKPAAVANSIQPTPSTSPTVGSVTPASPAAGSPVQVAVAAKEEAWVWVDADGKTVFEGMLKKGDQKTWSAQKTLTLGSGNAGGVTYTYNQGTTKTLGKRGVTQEITFPSEPNSTPTTTNQTDR